MADARVERRQLGQRLGLGRRVHPAAVLDLVLERGTDVGDELAHLPLAFGGEVALYVDLADALAERSVDQVDPALPAGALLRNVAQGLRVEVELRVVERPGQKLRIAADEVEGRPVLPCFERDRGEELRFALDRALFGHDDLAGVAESELVQRAIPVELRRESAQLGAGHRIVDLLDVAALLGRPVNPGDLALERDDAVGARLGIADPGEALDLDNVIAIGLAVGVVLGALQQVIVAVGHAEAVLRRVSGVARRVLEIGEDLNSDGRVEARLGEQFDQVAAGFHGRDPLKVGLERLRPQRLDRRLVHPACVGIADLLAEAAVGGRVLGHVLDDRADVALDLVVEDRIDSREGAVGGDIGALGPRAVHIIEEVVARLYCGVHRGRIVTPAAVHRFRGAGGHRRDRDQACRRKCQHFELHGKIPPRHQPGLHGHPEQIRQSPVRRTVGRLQPAGSVRRASSPPRSSLSSSRIEPP